MSSEIAIRVSGVSKNFLMFERPEDRLKQMVLPRLSRVAGREPRRYYRDFAALSDVSFEVRRGETVGIIGRNGSGKSTLLQIICGTLQPTTGNVEVNGRIAALLELGAGFNPEFTGRENVFMNAAILGLSRLETEARFDDIVRFADIGMFIDQPVKTYSSGMYVRLAFATAIHVEPDILVVDEALSVGDAFFQQKCFRWLKEFQERGTLFFCSHDLGAVSALCQRAVWLDRGTSRAVGSSKDVVEAYSAYAAAENMGLPETAVKATISNEVDEARREAASSELVSAAVRLEGNSFGSGLAEITHVRLSTADGREVGLVKGGQDLVLTIRAVARASLDRVIMGFHCKDRLGQVMFANNSFKRYETRPVQSETGQVLETELRFKMPMLCSGQYTLGVAIASGTQDVHVQHHYIHEVATIQLVTEGHIGGVLAVPLDDVSLKIIA